MKTGIAALSYICTLGIGVGIGVLSTRTYFSKKASERADAEIESMRRAMRKIDNDKNEEKFENHISKEHVVVSDMVKEINDVQFREYSTFSETQAAKEHPREEDIVKPYFIDIDDFDEPTLGYAKKELQYYMDDGTLIDEGENIDEDGQVVSIVDTVGTANLESFENSLESCCYIRNEQLKEDYEISKVFGSYSMLLGDD